MCQLWIELDPEVDLIALSRRSDHTGLRDMAVFDAVVNNADRKIGHLLPVADGHLYGCDHGVCFAEDYKLRTVLWQWRGKTLPRHSVEALRRLADDLAGGWLAGTPQAPEPQRGQRHEDPGGQAPQAPRPPLPLGRMARGPLAASLTGARARGRGHGTAAAVPANRAVQPRGRRPAASTGPGTRASTGPGT